MKLILEERYERSKIYAIDKIGEYMRRFDSRFYSLEFFASDEFLVIKVYRR